MDNTERLEYMLGNVAVGVALLDAQSFRIRYVNPYLRSLLGERWQAEEVVGHLVEEVVPEVVRKVALPFLHYVVLTGKRATYAEVPYEGFLEARGKTYWRVSIEAAPEREGDEEGSSLFVFIEDVTAAVRSRLHLHAIHHISAAIASGAALPQVLDHILQAIQDMVGSKRCAVFLIDQALADSEARIPGYEEVQRISDEEELRTARLAAYKGVHTRSYDWRPLVDERILLGQVERTGHALIITDTSAEPEIELPYLIHKGADRRPGSVLCVPIFEPSISTRIRPTVLEARETVGGMLLGSIEVYHRRARGFPAEEVALLEQFAQQAGLAIQTARLFRSIEGYARTARRSVHQKENVLQAIPDGVMIFDSRWRIVDLNQAVRKLFGWFGEMNGIPATQAFAQSSARFLDDFGTTVQLAERLERRAMAERVEEVKLEAADGQYGTWRASYTPIRDELGDIFAFIIIFHDVSREAEARERIEAEVVNRTAELAQQNIALHQARAQQDMVRARMELLLERLPSGVLLVDAQDRAITLMNGRATQILHAMGSAIEPQNDAATISSYAGGLNSDELLRPINLYGTDGKTVPYEEQPLYRALVEGEPAEAELHTTSVLGEPLHLLVDAAPLLAEGSVKSAILVLQDISKVKLLERVREDFFTTMAHELKTPLANIRAHLSALVARDLVWSSEEQYAFLQTADEQVERLVRMINQFLDASRVEAGALRLEIEPILLPELFEDLEDRLEALISSSGRTLQLKLADGIPAVRGDYELLMSVLTNLLSNAFRYAPKGDSVLLEVEPLYDTSNKRVSGVTISVIDRGPGMTQEQQLKLFTRFSTFAEMSRPSVDRPGQPAEERRRGGGRWSPATGLGLYISRGIIQAHGSTLQLRSAPGQGAHFSFTLPVFTRRRHRT